MSRIGEKKVTRYSRRVSWNLEDEKFAKSMRPEHVAVLKERGGYGEIAARLGVAVGTVKSRLHRARAELTRLRMAGLR